MTDIEKISDAIRGLSRTSDSTSKILESLTMPTNSLMHRIANIVPKNAFESAAFGIPDQALLRALQPSSAMMELHRQTTEFTKRMASMFDAINEPYRQLNESMQRVASGFQPFMAKMARMHHHQERLESAGWLPHTSTPFALLDENEAEQDGVILENYYRENWAEVKEQFLETTDALNIDNTAKNVFKQALQAHESGLYSLVARSLFPEIERVTRVELHTGEMETVTSQKTLRERAGTLSTHDFQDLGYWGFVLFSSLDHIYDYCNTVDHKIAFSMKPIPNRHAAIHGHVVYDNLCSSLNALIITEFIFQVVTTLKQSNDA